MDVTVEDPFQPPHYHGGNSDGSGGDAGGISARAASLMNIGFCDFAGMLVPCALVESFSQTIHEAGPLQESLWYNPTGAFDIEATQRQSKTSPKPPKLKRQEKKPRHL